MNLQLTSKTAFISGSTQGIGYAIARQLLAEGAKVIVNGRSQEKVDRAISTLQAEFPGEAVSGIAADLENTQDIDRLTRSLPEIDILINNAGMFELKPFFDIPDDEWTRFFQVNVMSGVRLSRALMPGMLERNWGRVVFISSESAIDVPGDMIHYGMTKTAMLSVSRGLSQLTKGTQVTVNTILGGPTYSDGVAGTIEAIARQQNIPAEQLKTHIMSSTNPNSLLGRFIESDEIASLATYLCSPLAIATNGASLRADGGVLNSI